MRCFNKASSLKPYSNWRPPYTFLPFKQKHFASSLLIEERREQTFGIGTLNALFKYILNRDNIRLSFFKAFIPDYGFTSSSRIPLQGSQHLHNFIHDNDTTKIVKEMPSFGYW